VKRVFCKNPTLVDRDKAFDFLVEGQTDIPAAPPKPAPVPVHRDKGSAVKHYRFTAFQAGEVAVVEFVSSDYNAMRELFGLEVDAQEAACYKDALQQHPYVYRTVYWGLTGTTIFFGGRGVYRFFRHSFTEAAEEGVREVVVRRSGITTVFNNNVPTTIDPVFSGQTGQAPPEVPLGQNDSPPTQTPPDAGGPSAENTAPASKNASGPSAAQRYSGKLIKVPKQDPAADALAEKLGGELRVRFEADPENREFDAVSDEYIGQAKPALRGVGKSFRNQAKATFEAAQATGRKAYFEFEGQPADDVLKLLQRYAERYGAEYVIDILSKE